MEMESRIQLGPVMLIFQPVEAADDQPGRRLRSGRSLMWPRSVTFTSHSGTVCSGAEDLPSSSSEEHLQENVLQNETVSLIIRTNCQSFCGCSVGTEVSLLVCSSV